MSPGLAYLHMKTYWRGYLWLAYLRFFRRSIVRRASRRTRPPGTIVSLTTFGARVDIVDVVILSILRGRVIPEAICLYADETSARRLLKRGCIAELVELGLLQVNAVPDVRAYTKLVYALEESKKSRSSCATMMWCIQSIGFMTYSKNEKKPVNVPLCAIVPTRRFVTETVA